MQTLYKGFPSHTVENHKVTGYALLSYVDEIGLLIRVCILEVLDLVTNILRLFLQWTLSSSQLAI